MTKMINVNINAGSIDPKEGEEWANEIVNVYADMEIADVQAIDLQPTDINSIVIASGLPVPRVLSTLSVLEMRRLVRRVSGQLVQRI